jgi:hypothetical protein
VLVWIPSRGDGIAKDFCILQASERPSPEKGGLLDAQKR